MGSNSHTKAQMKYDAVNTKKVMFKFNLKYDADILEKLESVGNRQGYVKKLIRDDIERTCNKSDM